MHSRTVVSASNSIDRLRNNDPTLKVLNLIDPATPSDHFSYERFKDLNLYYDSVLIRAKELNQIAEALCTNTNLHTLMLPICIGATPLIDHDLNWSVIQIAGGRANAFMAAIANFVAALEQNDTMHTLVLFVNRFDKFDNGSDDILSYPFAAVMQIMRRMLPIFSNTTSLQHIHLVDECFFKPAEICEHISDDSKLKGLYLYGYGQPRIINNEHTGFDEYLESHDAILVAKNLSARAPRLENLTIRKSGIDENAISEIISIIAKARYKPNQVQLNVRDNIDGFAIHTLIFSGLNMMGINYNPIRDRKKHLRDQANQTDVKARLTMLYMCFRRRLSEKQKNECNMPDIPWQRIETVRLSV